MGLVTEGTDPAREWLVDAADPRLTPDRLNRMADGLRPDRLAWNAFGVLGLWNTEAWVPSLVERACGAQSPLVEIEWADGTILPWAVDVLGPELCDMTVQGPEGHLVIAATLDPDPPAEQLRAAAVAAVEGSMPGGGREPGLVVVAPPGPATDGLDDRLDAATDVEVHDGRRIADLLAGRTGWVTWTTLGRLALDLAEEGGDEPMEQVRRLVTELQLRYPDQTF